MTFLTIPKVFLFALENRKIYKLKNKMQQIFSVKISIDNYCCKFKRIISKKSVLGEKMIQLSQIPHEYFFPFKIVFILPLYLKGINI